RSLARRARTTRAARPAGAAGAARALLRLRLRPDLHDARLRPVGRVPGVVVEQLPAGQVDEPAHAGRARGLARLFDDGHTLEERRVRDLLGQRRPRVDERTRLADDAAVGRRAVQPDVERVG